MHASHGTVTEGDIYRIGMVRLAFASRLLRVCFTFASRLSLASPLPPCGRCTCAVLTLFAVVNRSQEEPPDVKDLVDACIGPAGDVPIEATGRALQGFQWPANIERSSIFAWRRLLNRLDEYLKFVTEWHIVKLLDAGKGAKEEEDDDEYEDVEEELPVNDDEVVAALDCSLEILRHVAGKEHYEGLPQLCDLLASSNPVIVNKTLRVLLCVYERNVTGIQPVPPDLSSRLQAIAVPQCGPSLLNVGKRDVSVAKEKDGAHLKFSIDPNPVEHVDERTDEEKQVGSTDPVVVKYHSRSELPENDFKALKSIMDTHGPVRGRRQRFRLLRSIRASGVYDFSEEQLELEACNRLLAAATLVPVGVLGEVYGRVQETFRKLGADELLREIFSPDTGFSDQVIICGLQAFTAKFAGLERSSLRVDGLDRLLQDGKYSPLGVFLETRCSRSRVNSELGVRLAEEAISLVNALCSMNYLCDGLLEAEVLECIVPFVSDPDPSVRGICERSLSTLELLFTNSTSGMSRLIACNGFDVVQDRLRSEVTAARSVAVLGYQDMYLIKKLLKALTRMIMTSDASGIDEKKVEVLYWAIKEIFVAQERFGSGVFDAATSCFREVLHFDPLQYKTMSSLELDVSYVEAVSNMKGRDGWVSLNIVPTLSAICLSEAGRELVKSRSALHFVAETFMDVQALCSLPPSHAMGRSLEEMTRHHESMLGDVVEMLVSTVDIVRKIAHTGEIKVEVSGPIVKNLPNFISIAISRLTELLIPVCEANKAAAKAFLEQGGLQMFIDLAQPNLCVDCFSCTQAGHSVVSLLRSLILLEEQREYALEVTLSSLRASLDNVNRIFLELEKDNDYSDDFCLSTWKQKPFRQKFEELIPALSKSTILMSGFAFRRAGAAEHKGHAVFIDASLCVLPELERCIGRVMRLLAVSDAWRIEKDISEVHPVRWEIDAEKDRQDEIELRRDVLNLFFRSTCTFYNNMGRLGDNAELVWSEQNGWPASHHKEAQEVIGLLSANAAIGALADLARREKGGPELERHTIRACRLVTAVLFDQRKKALFSCPVNAFARYGGLDMLLKLTSRAGSNCLEVSRADVGVFTPTLKDIKEQERCLEITGIGRTPLEKDLERPEWERRTVVISAQHALLSILGILEIITARGAYKDSESGISPRLYEPPYWADEAADSLQRDLVHSICRHSGACLLGIGFGRAWSTAPLPLAKYFKCLSNCYKEGPDYLARYSAMDTAPLDEQQLEERLAKDKERPTFSLSPNVGMDLKGVVKKFHDIKASIILDAYCRSGMVDRLEARQSNRATATQPAGESRSLLIWDDKTMGIKSFSVDSFRVLTPIDQPKSNPKPAKVMVERSMALAHVLISVDCLDSRSRAMPSTPPRSLVVDKEILIDPAVPFSRATMKSSLEELLGLVSALPWSVQDIADTLVECYGKDEGLCVSLASKVQSQISQSVERVDGMSASELEGWAKQGRDDILSPVMHLLGALLNVSSIYRRHHSEGVLAHVLGLLDRWRQGCIAVKKLKAGNTLRVPRWVDAALLILAIVFEEKFKPDKHALSADSIPTGAVPPMETFQAKVRGMLRPVQEDGEVAQFLSASSHAIDCLKMSLKYAEHGWSPLSEDEIGSPGRFYDPCPRSSVAATLELLTTTSKVRKAADAILTSRGHNLILSLSEPLHTAESDKMVAQILRQLVEDNEALQAYMEATIRSGMQKKRRGLHLSDGARGYKTFSVKQFVASFLHLACRNSAVFLEAVLQTCKFSIEGSSVRVDCLPDGDPSDARGTSDRGAPDATSPATMKPPGPNTSEGASPAHAEPPVVQPEATSSVPKGGKKVHKSSPKKANRKSISPAATVMDAIVGRLFQASTSAFVQKMAESCKKHSVNEAAAQDPKMMAEVFCICQQALCINILSTLVASFSTCVTAFLRRDSDPLPDWLARHPGKSPAKGSLHTPQVKNVGEQETRARPGQRRPPKAREQKPHSAPKASQTGPASGTKSKSSVADACFLIHAIVRNQISYHGSPHHVPMRQALSKDACSLLITLSQRSKEGQMRVCRELGCILRAYAYYPALSISTSEADPSLQEIALRSLEKRESRSISADLEGSLVLLATMLSVGIPGQFLSQDVSHQKELIESLLCTGFVEVLVDVISCMDLSDAANDRTKVCLSAIIRSLEKLTSVRATDKPHDDQIADGDLQNFEELIAHLNDRGWHLAGEDSGEGSGESDLESNEDGMEMEFNTGSDLSDGPSYFSDHPSYLSDTSYSSLSDHVDEFDMGIEHSGGDSSGTDDMNESEEYSSDPFTSSSGHISGSMGDDSDEDMMDHDTGTDSLHDDDDDDDDDDVVIGGYEFDYRPNLDDIFPPEETDLDHAEFHAHDAPVNWGNHEPNDFNRVHRDLMFDDNGDSDDEDGLLDGNEGTEMYYSDEDLEEDIASAPFGDDRLVGGHALANTPVPPFWIQEGNGDQDTQWRDCDPLFGTAFISPRLLSTHIGLFRRNRETESRLPASPHNHPLITGAYGNRDLPDPRHSSGRMEDMMGRLRRSAPPMPIPPFPSMGPLMVGFRAHPVTDPRVYGTDIPDRVVDGFASAFDESMGGRAAGGNRRRDRLGLPGEWLSVGGERATSPTFARPRQRQRTDEDQERLGVEAQDPGDNVITVDRASGPNDHADALAVTSDPAPAPEPVNAAPRAAGASADLSQELEPIDPEFLAALPPDIQREVIENREREVRARRIAREDRRRIESIMPFYIDEERIALASSEDAAEGEGADIGVDTAENGGAIGGSAPSAFARSSAMHRLPGGEGPSHPEERTETRSASPPRAPLPTEGRRNLPFRQIMDVDDLPRHPLREEEGILPAQRDFYRELQMLREDGDAFGSQLTRLFDTRRMMDAVRHRVLETRARGNRRGPRGDPRDLRILHSFRETSDRLVDIQSDRRPLLQENQIPQLIKLLRFSRWEGRLHLNRAIRHLTESKATGSQVFEQLFALLRCPLSSCESDYDSLSDTLARLNHPMPSLLTDLHGYVVATHGSCTVVRALGLEPQDGDLDVDNGIIATAVVRRLLELLRHCFNLVKRGVDVILTLDKVAPLYSVYQGMMLIESEPVPATAQNCSIPALDVLLSLPLRHGVSKGNLRGVSLDLVCKFLAHFEKTEADIRDKEQRIRDKKIRAAKASGEAQFPSITRLEIEKIEKERDALVDKAAPVRQLFKSINPAIVRNYVMMLTYPSLKESETESVRMILQSLTVMNIEHWETLCDSAAEFVQVLSAEARADLDDLAAGNVTKKIWKPDTKGKGVFRCLQAVAEGVFQLVVDRFDPSGPSLPEVAQTARKIAALALSRMLERTKESLWEPFNAAASAIEEHLKEVETSTKVTLPLPVQLIRPYVESYFLLHDTLRCSTCSLEVLSREISELTEEEEAWTNKREEIARAAEEQATTSFTRIQSVDFNSLPKSAENSANTEKTANHTSCLPSSDSDFMRFAENHRTLVNLIASHAPTVLEESMNMLLKHPKLLDFENKRIYFRKRVQGLARQLSHHARLELNIRRLHAFEDSFNQLRVVSKSQLRSPLKVKFTGEEGIDAGGVSREWYQVMSREMFNPAISLFEAVPQGSSTYQPNPNSIVQTDEARGISHLDYFKFVGHVVGKALLDDQVIDAHFTRSFYKHLLGQPLTYKDIEGVDPEFFKNLTWMLDNSIDGVFDLTFSEENDFFGQKSVIELCPNGANIKVTDENKRDYVDAIARHRMISAIQPQIHAFLEGFWNVLPRVSLQMFSDHELELMISGLPDVDVLDLRANCEYHGGYSATSQVVLWFWEILIAMDREQRALLLQFVTGTSKVPVGGFGELQAISGRQKFQIHKAYGDTDRLPTAHTCFNQLDLPPYNTKEQLRERLLLAIHEGKEGFGFA